MPISQNLTFTGAAPADREYPHPPGLAIIRAVHKGAMEQGWLADDWDNWRDCGWIFRCSRGAAVLEVALAPNGEGRWMMQVAPADSPGVLGRTFGRRPSATPEDCLVLAKVVHGVVSGAARYSDLRWAWDGRPSADSEGEPVAP